jgi:hypothetical protein
MTANAASGLLWVSGSARIYRLCCRCSVDLHPLLLNGATALAQQTSPFGQNSSAALVQLNQAIDGDVAPTHLHTGTLAFNSEAQISGGQHSP